MALPPEALSGVMVCVCVFLHEKNILPNREQMASGHELTLLSFSSIWMLFQVGSKTLPLKQTHIKERDNMAAHERRAVI